MKKLAISSLFLVLAMSSSIVNAAMVEISLSNPFTFTNSKNKTLTFTYDESKLGTTVDKIAVGDSFNPQNPTNVGDVVKSTFGLSTLNLSSQIDSLGGGSSATIKSNTAYDYLAIHMGQYEVFFHFASLVAANKEFDISVSGKGSGLSNYRAYDSGLSAVPVPAAAFMFAPALLGFMGLRRRAKNRIA